MKTIPGSCPVCWSPMPAGATSCPACGHGQPASRRHPGVWLPALLGVAAGVAGTLWFARERVQAPEAAAVTAGPEEASAPAAVDSAPAPASPQRQHACTVHDASGEAVGTVLLLDAGTGPLGLLPRDRLPLRGPLRDAEGKDLDLEVLAVADAYGFILLRGLAVRGMEPLRPRRTPVDYGQPLVVAASEGSARVVGHAPAALNELVLDGELPDGAVLLDGDGCAAALCTGGRRALGVSPVWSWLGARWPPQPLADVQAELRARDPARLLEDATHDLNAATTPEATRAALERLELGFAMARGQELVGGYDNALRAGHRLLAQRLSEAGRTGDAFTHVKTSLQRFAGDIDLLADAVVLAANAGEFLAASEFWFELRSRDGPRAQQHAAGLVDAFMRAANERTGNAPRGAVDLLARAVELFPDHASLRMSYAGALLAAGDGDSALWQARIAATRDPSLTARFEAIAARTTTSGSAVEVPIDPDSQIIRTACSVAGHPIELVVDTGASITVLPRAFAASGISTGRRVRIQTASGLVEAELVRLPELKIGTITVRQILAATVDLPGTLAGKGLLGMNVLRRLNLELDAARGVLVLRK